MVTPVPVVVVIEAPVDAVPTVPELAPPMPVEFPPAPPIPTVPLDAAPPVLVPSVPAEAPELLLLPPPQPDIALTVAKEPSTSEEMRRRV